jgi:hypothetical protein
MLFDDIKRFGFTTCEHFSMRFSTSIAQAWKRLPKLVRAKYLKVLARTEESKRKIYVPDFRFFEICPYKETNKLNIFNINHDEYLLKLFCSLKNKNWGSEIILEQDLKKKNSDKNKLNKIPDMILNHNGGSFIFEYERVQKAAVFYKKIGLIYADKDPNLNYFVFLTESKCIASKIRENVSLQYFSIINAKKFLSLLESTTKDHLINYIEDPLVTYFKYN